MARIANDGGWQISSFNAQHCDVSLLVHALYLGDELAAIGEFDGDFRSAIHHMGIGQNQAVGGNNQPRPLAAHRLLRARHLRGKTAEKIEERIVEIRAFVFVAGGASLARDTDIDDSRTKALDDGRKIHAAHLGADWLQGRRSCDNGRRTPLSRATARLSDPISAANGCCNSQRECAAKQDFTFHDDLLAVWHEGQSKGQNLKQN